MSAFAPIDLNDGQGTPQSHTFSPSVIDPNGVARLFEDGDVPFDGRNAISLGVKLPKNGSQVARVTAKVVVPVMDSIDSTKKIGEVIFNGEFVIPKGATLAQRSDILAYAANFLADTSVEDAVTKLESVY